MMRRLLLILTVLMALMALSLTASAEKSDQKSDLPQSKTQITDIDQMLETGRAAIAARSGEEINWQVISSGGTEGTSTNFALKGTVGQTAAGEGSSTNYGLSHGFWQEFGAPSCCVGIRGNVDGDPGNQVNVADLTYLVDYLFRGGPPPPCTEEGNVDGDPGEQINVADLTYLVDYLFRGGPLPVTCP